MQDFLKSYGPLVLSLFFHVHRHAELNLLPSAGMIELVLCSVVVAYFAYESHSKSPAQAQAGGAKTEESNELLKKLQEHSKWVPVTNVLQAIYLDHLAASKGRSRRQRGGKRRSRRSRSKSRRRRRSKKN